jgi:hypothetical protein
MPTVPIDGRQQFDGTVAAMVNAQRGRLPYDNFTHIGGGRYIANDPPPVPFSAGISPAVLSSAVEAPDQGPASRPAARALWPDLK